MEDPYESFRISTSQEELLNSVPFVGDTLTSPCNCNNHHHSAASEIIPPVILFSAPDTQHVDNQDVFHTPPPLPSSVIDVPQCEFNQAVIDVDDDDVSQTFVHFPGFEKDSELGFVEKSRFFEEDRVSEFPEIHPDEFSVLDRAISDFDKAPVKLGFETQQVVENDAEDVNKSSEEEIIEICRMRKGPVLDLMPDSIRSSFEKATANDKEKKHTFTVFDVLKVLAETTTVKEDDDDGLTVLETAKRAGVIFPRPTWWPEDMKSQLFNF